MGKFYAQWQPPRAATEDAHTALVFGFLRHAPSAAPLAPWLADVLKARVTVDGVDPANFWPNVPSVIGGSYTEPELVFGVIADARPRLVVIENKLGDAQHTLQVRRRVSQVHSRDGRGDRGNKRGE